MSSAARDSIGAPYRDVLRILTTVLRGMDAAWALTGSTSFVLQGVPLDPDDVDLQTTRTGAYEIGRRIETRAPGTVLTPVSFSAAEQIRSHFGAFMLQGIRVEVMGAVQKRRADGTWDRPVDVGTRRTFVEMGRTTVPVLPLSYEADAYEQLGRTRRAAFLRKHAG